MSVLQAKIHVIGLEGFLTANDELFAPLIASLSAFLGSTLYQELNEGNDNIKLTNADYLIISDVYKAANMLLGDPRLIPGPQDVAKIQVIRLLNNITAAMVNLLIASQNQEIIEASKSLTDLRQQMKALNQDLKDAKTDLGDYVAGVKNMAKVAKGLDITLSILIKLAALL